MYYVGLDVHKQSIVMCILDANGKVCKESRERHIGPVLQTLRALRGPLSVCYEASCGYGFLHDRLAELPNVKRIVVAHPGQVRLIFRSKRKNDRIDAAKLAKLLFLDQVPQVHVPALEVRSWRRAIEFRRRLVDDQTRVKNRLRALLREHGIAAPHRKRLWTQVGLAWLRAQALATPMAGLQRHVLLDDLERVRQHLKTLERDLDRIGRQHPGVLLLRTIPGVGPRTAEAVVAYIDSPLRFGRSRQVANYFGLVPCQDQSADKNRLGHITREGPATVRKLLCEASWQGVLRSPEIRAHFERICDGHPGRRRIALVATANWLVRVMFAMLRSGEVSRFTKFARGDRDRKGRSAEGAASSAPAASVPAASAPAVAAPAA